MNLAILFFQYIFFTAAEWVYTQSLGLSQIALIYGKIIVSFERNGGWCWEEATILPGPLYCFFQITFTLYNWSSDSSEKYTEGLFFRVDTGIHAI